MSRGTLTEAMLVKYSMTDIVVKLVVCEIVTFTIQMLHIEPIVMQFAIWISACTG